MKYTLSPKFNEQSFIHKNKKIKGVKNYCIWIQYNFCFHKCLTTKAFKKVQYGYCGKSGVFSDNSECTYRERNSNVSDSSQLIDIISSCAQHVGHE